MGLSLDFRSLFASHACHLIGEDDLGEAFSHRRTKLIWVLDVSEKTRSEPDGSVFCGGGGPDQ